MNIYKVATFVLSISCLVLIYWLNSLQHDNRLLTENIVSLTKSVDTLTDSLDKIAANAQGRVAQDSPVMTSDKHTYETSAKPDEVAFIEDQGILSESEGTESTSTDAELLQFAESMQKGDDPYVQIEEQFNQEVVDHNWAYDYQAKIQALAIDNNAGFLIHDMTCKTTVCEVSVNTNGVTGLNTGMAFSKLTADAKWEGASPLVFFRHEAVDGMMKIYLKRNEAD